MPGHPDRLAARVRTAIIDAENMVLASSATIWEIGIKRALGKLDCPDDLLEQVHSHRVDVLSIDAEHAWQAALLPPIHRDPFDRMLVAQSLALDLVLVTADQVIPRYGGRVLRT